VDLRVLAFALAVSIGTGIAFGLAPALRASSIDLLTSLKDAAPAVPLWSWSRSRSRSCCWWARD
jgi:hypothetical protein